MFERGLLDKGGVNSTEHEILQNIDRGYDFFCGWLDTIITKCKPSIMPQGLLLLLCACWGSGGGPARGYQVRAGDLPTRKATCA